METSCLVQHSTVRYELERNGNRRREGKYEEFHSERPLFIEINKAIILQGFLVKVIFVNFQVLSSLYWKFHISLFNICQIFNYYELVYNTHWIWSNPLSDLKRVSIQISCPFSFSSPVANDIFICNLSCNTLHCNYKCIFNTWKLSQAKKHTLIRWCW